MICLKLESFNIGNVVDVIKYDESSEFKMKNKETYKAILIFFQNAPVIILADGWLPNNSSRRKKPVFGDATLSNQEQQYVMENFPATVRAYTNLGFKAF